MTDNIAQQMKQFATFSTTKRSTLSNKSLTNFNMYFKKYYAIYGDELNATNLTAYLANSTLSNNSKASISYLLAKFFLVFNYITQDEYNKIVKLYRQKFSNWSVQHITSETILELLHYYKAKNNDDMLNWVFITSAIGIRLNQSLALQMFDIEIEATRITFNIINQKHNEFNEYASKSVKSIAMSYNIHNKFTMHNTLIPFLQSKMKLYKNDPTAYLFHLKERNIQRSLQLFGDIYEVKITPHSLRHYVGTKIANEVGILKASLLLGHSDIKTTQRYISNKIDTSEFIK